jgi:hypothetical protein
MKKLVLFSFFLAAIQSLFSQEINSPESYVPGEVLVQIDDPMWLPQIIGELQIVNSAFTGLRVSKEISRPVNIWLFAFDENVITHEAMLTALSANKHILIAQNNHYIQMRSTTPNDPIFTSQWHHIDGSDNDIDSDLAWDITTGGATINGDEIVVCVIEDQGASWNHEDLLANHWVNTLEIDGNGIDDDGNGYIDDYHGWNTTANNDNIGAGPHGTSVSGMIGATGNNATDATGINWNVKIMQVDMSASLTESAVIAAYTYPLTMRQLYTSSGGTEGAFVVATNASWGIDNANPASYPLWCNFYNTLGQAGILNCGATANNNLNMDVVGDMPTGCSSPYMISVTATNSSDVRTFSGYGQTTIDVGAPGGNIVTLANTNTTASMSGTSFASPLTAGVIALLYSVPCQNLADLSMSDPQAAADLVRNALLDGVDPVANLTTETVTGGRINAYNSILLIQSSGCATCDMALTSSSQNTLCNSSCDGQIVVNPTGGSGSFTYDIGGGPQASNTFTGLCDGNYTVTVDDGDLCNQSIDFTITSPTGLSGSTSVTHEFFGTDGAINLTATGGTAPYTYTWTGPSSFTASTEDISGLVAGTYSASILDANGCAFVIAGIVVNPPPACTMLVSNTVQNITCVGDCDGEITLTPTGGTGSYTFDIGSGTQTSGNFTALCDGNYSIVVDDGAVCNETFNITISSPAAISGTTNLTHELLGNDGAIDLTVTGGTAPYNFSWTGPSSFTASSEDLAGLTTGTYEVTITDDNGCITVISNIIVSSSVGISANEFEFSIYPNPTQKEFTLSLSDGQQVTLVLYDAIGNTVLTQHANKTTSIGVSTLAKGIYVYTITTQNGNQATGKLVIE